MGKATEDTKQTAALHEGSEQDSKASDQHTPGRRREVKKPPLLFEETQAVTKELTDHLGGPVIALYGDIFGEVVFLSHQLLEKLGKQQKLFLVLCSYGGQGTCSLRLIDVIHQYTNKLVVLIPRACASAATMIALGAHEIQMGPVAYLTAVDTSLTHPRSPLDHVNVKVSIELDELLRVVKLWKQAATDSDEPYKDNPYKYLYSHIHPLVIGAVDRCSSLSVKICEEILSHHMSDKDRITTISNSLNSDYPSHNYPITRREAIRLGLPIKPMETEICAKSAQLMALYSEMTQGARTDFDSENYHSNTISNIVEGSDFQFVYQYDKDWYYRREEKRWVHFNDSSGWYKFHLESGQVKQLRIYPS